MNRCGCNDACDGEWTNEVGSQLRTGGAQRDVSCRKPNLLSDGETRCWTAVTISEPLYSSDVSKYDAMGLLPYPVRTLTRVWAAGTPTSFCSPGKMGGWYPRHQANGDMAVDETGKLL